MAFRYEVDPACGRDLRQLTKRNQPLLLDITVEHIPAILRDPHGAGEQKRGPLSRVRAYNVMRGRVAYRLIYQIEDDVVVFIAVGPHDAAYASATRRV